MRIDLEASLFHECPVSVGLLGGGGHVGKSKLYGHSLYCMGIGRNSAGDRAALLHVGYACSAAALPGHRGSVDSYVIGFREPRTENVVLYFYHMVNIMKK